MNNTSIEGRLSTIFLKKGQEGRFTKLFRNLPDVDKRAILSAAELVADELPIIADFRSSLEWSLITTNRVIWNDLKGVQALPVADIIEVGIHLDRNQSPPHKITTDRLKMKTNDRRLLEVQFEPGGPLVGAWNALRFFSVHNHKTASG